MGFDVHRLVPDRELWLGGIRIPHTMGLLGHSDADVVFHAVSDALLGALALGDIGQHFPPNDPACEGIDSSLILTHCYDLVKKRGYRLGNLDVGLSAEAPRLLPYAEAMRSNLARLLETDQDNIGLQLMTNEGLDAIGEKKAIRATATLLLERTSL